MIIVKSFKAVDFELICPHAIDKTVSDFTPEQIRILGERYEKSGCGFTGWWDDVPYGCLGIWTVREGVGNMWSAIHKDVSKHVIPAMRAVKEMLNVIEGMYDFKRLRSDSRIGFPESQRFLEFLGFTKQRRNVNHNHYFYKRDVPCQQQQ